MLYRSNEEWEDAKTFVKIWYILFPLILTCFMLVMNEFKYTQLFTSPEYKEVPADYVYS